MTPAHAAALVARQALTRRGRRRITVAVTVLAATVAPVALILGAAVLTGGQGPATVCSQTLPPAQVPGETDQDLTLDDVRADPVMWATAQAIWTEAAVAGSAREQAAVIGVATALQESTLDWTLTEAESDRDSVGAFQQRRPWGPLRASPDGAARQFFTGGAGGQRGLLDIDGWQSMPLTVAAQTVQVSAFPSAYAKWEPLARQIVAAAAEEQPATEVAPAALTDPACVPAESEPDVVLAAAVSEGGWTSPVAPSDYRISSRYGPRGGDHHGGLDYAASCGTPILAASAGEVITSTYHPSWGNYVVLAHAGGVQTLYAHMPDGAARVGPGRTVNAGQPIGAVGNTGNSFGCHLHLEVRTGAIAGGGLGTRTNPEPFLTARGATP